MLRTFCTNMPIFGTSPEYRRAEFEEVQFIMTPPLGLLSFADRKIKMDDAAKAEEVAQTIEKASNIVTLELKGNTIGVEAGERLAQAIQKHPEIKKCYWSDMFTGRLKSEIPPILKSLCGALIRAPCHITELDLSDNAFGPIGAEGISEFLVSPAAFTLETLKLNNNGLGGGGVIVANCLTECAENARRNGTQFRLKKFVAGRNRLEIPGATALSKAFSLIGTLEEITIPQNGIAPPGIQALAECFKHNKSLKIINFNDNTCSVAGALALANGIKELHKLEILNLGDCLCRDQGVSAIVDVLSQGNHKNIQSVDFSGSELTGLKALNIVRLWIQKLGKSKLELTNNCLGSCFEDIAEMATDCPNINLGSESDDEGSLSERESDEDEDDEDEEYDDEGEYDDEDEGFQQEEKADKTESILQDLLNGVGCMRVDNKPIQPHEILSFLDKQFKLNEAQDAQVIVSAINTMKSMKVLELRGNTLGINAGRVIADALRGHPELQRCLWSDLFTGRLKNEIPPILKSLCGAMIQANCQITELDLSDNAFGPIGAEGIQDFLVSPAAYSLEVLKLNNNGLGAGGKIIASCLQQCYRNSVRDGRPLRLKTFIAGRNRLENPGAIALAAAFTEMGSLEELAIPQNGIAAPGIEALAGALAYNPNLRIISFNDNSATRSGSFAVATAIMKLHKLETLNLGDCLCRDQGSTRIIDALLASAHPNLKEVDLSGSEMTPPVAKAIFQKWRNFPSAKLTVSANNFGSEWESVKQMAGSNVFMGDDDDDQGTLSDCESVVLGSSDEENEHAEMYSDDSSDDSKPSANHDLSYFQNLIQPIENDFNCVAQEKAAKALLQLALVYQQSQGRPDVFQLVKESAIDIVSRVSSIRKRPIPTTTQLINQIAAQLGFVKPEVSWNLRPEPRFMTEILYGLLDSGLLSDERGVILHFFPRSS